MEKKNCPKKFGKIAFPLESSGGGERECILITSFNPFDDEWPQDKTTREEEEKEEAELEEAEEAIWSSCSVEGGLYEE